MTAFLPVLAAFLLIGGPGSLALDQEGTGGKQAARSPDPWALVRGCTAVLDKVVACRSDKRFRALTSGWIAAAGGKRSAAGKAIEARLRSWLRRDARRQQCSVWASRDGAAAHVGAESKLAKLAAESGTACGAFARELESDTWLPAAIREH